MNPEHSSGDAFEPVSPEFHGKEAVRIRNVKKEYNEKPERVKALQGKEKNFFVLMFLTKKKFCFLKIQTVIGES